jgi:hypothetical protein
LGIGRHGAIDVSPERFLFDEYRRQVTGAPIDRRTSDYCWHHARRDLLSEPLGDLYGAEVVLDATACEWRLVAYLQRLFHASAAPSAAGPLWLLERDPARPGRAPRDCEPIQQRHKVRLRLCRVTGPPAS